MPAGRADLAEGRSGPGLARLEAECRRITAVYAAAGAVPVNPPALQPADLLLDLYGEDLRGRAYVTTDPVAGEMMLRPDFTVPVAGLHMARGGAPARYAYCGPVWRQQETGSARPNEFLQAGVEFFGDPDPAEADAEVFLLIRAALGDAPAEMLTGDMGVLASVVAGLATAPHRRAALRRHLWRPARFRDLLDRFGAGHAAATAARRPLLDRIAAEGAAAVAAAAGEAQGGRSTEEVAAGLEAIAVEAATPPLSAAEVGALEAVMAVTGTAREALAAFRALAPAAPGLAAAADRMADRLAALARHGIDAGALPFASSFGRTTLEYYDGFVFGARAPGRPDLPPLASGGRYDQLTAALGRGAALPAVGAIVRPEVLIAAREGA
jgi:ATP phosphoribosyltransferase regulatory subunit